MHAEDKVTFMIVCPVLYTVNIYLNKAENLSKKKKSQASVTDRILLHVFKQPKNTRDLICHVDLNQKK